MNSYLETKEIIEKVDKLVKQHNITNEDLIQDLFVMMLEEKNKGVKDANSSLLKKICEEVEKEEEQDITQIDQEYNDDEIGRNSNAYKRIELQNDIKKFLENLPMKEKDYIEYYFGLNGNSPHNIHQMKIEKNDPDAEKFLKNAIEHLKDVKGSSILRYYIFEI